MSPRAGSTHTQLKNIAFSVLAVCPQYAGIFSPKFVAVPEKRSPEWINLKMYLMFLCGRLKPELKENVGISCPDEPLLL